MEGTKCPSCGGALKVVAKTYSNVLFNADGTPQRVEVTYASDDDSWVECVECSVEVHFTKADSDSPLHAMWDRGMGAIQAMEVTFD